MAGFSVTPGRPILLNCPACGGSITLRAAGHSVTAVCAYCGSLLDVNRPELRIIEQSHEAARRPLITIGLRARFEDQPWEVIGYQEKSIGGLATEVPLMLQTFLSQKDSWQEYLLFNPYHGFRFLSQADGHWTLHRVVKGAKHLPKNQIFQRFSAGMATVDYVLGEFYWRVKKGDRAQISDSIAPPYVLSVEKTGDEINTAIGTYLAATEVAAAFGMDRNRLPKTRGVAPHQPSPFAARLPGILRIALAALAIATAIQLLQAFGSDGKVIHTESFDIATETPELTHVSPPFGVAGGSANLCLASQVNLDNDWAELEASLVNEATGETRTATLGMEYYSGIEDDERWSEGNPRASACFPAVSQGMYRLVLEADGGAFHTGQPGSRFFMVEVKRDVPIWSNWTALLLALLPYPGYLWLRHRGFESARWSGAE
jgi:hypothetical protein